MHRGNTVLLRAEVNRHFRGFPAALVVANPFHSRAVADLPDSRIGKDNARRILEEAGEFFFLYSTARGRG